MTGVRIGLVLAALLLLLSIRAAEKPADRLAGLVLGFGRTAEARRSQEDTDVQEDDVDNRRRWRLLTGSCVILGLTALFLLISVFTLNRKINTLYGSVRNLEEAVREMQED